MEQTAFQARYEEYVAEIEKTLASQFTAQQPYGKLYESMRYSLLSGGKRLRSVLTLEFARLCALKSNWRRALPFACAIEMIHTYSLIHDDLPCMDDDELRRGKPTNHIVFGETMAVLAGDALQSAAFSLLLSSDLSAEARAEGAKLLAAASGPDGMVAGQVLDLSQQETDEESLRLLHSLKTGALISAAAELGCIAANATPMAREKARAYAGKLGLAFQIRDDMLDVIGDESTFGKPIGSDKDEEKTTFVDLLGLDGCAAEVERLTQEAVAALDGLGDTAFLKELAYAMAVRVK